MASTREDPEADGPEDVWEYVGRALDNLFAEENLETGEIGPREDVESTLEYMLGYSAFDWRLEEEEIEDARSGDYKLKIEGINVEEEISFFCHEPRDTEDSVYIALERSEIENDNIEDLFEGFLDTLTYQRHNGTLSGSLIKEDQKNPRSPSTAP